MTAPPRRITTEALVVGSGAGGALTAATLAEAGVAITVVEEGPWLDHGTVEPFSRQEMIAKYRDRGVNVTVGRPPIAYVEGRCVGGGTEINSGLYHRPPPELLARWKRDFAIADLDADDLADRAASIEKALTISPLPGPAPAASQVLSRGASVLGWEVKEVPRWFAYPEGAGALHDGVKQTMTRTYIPRAVSAGAEVIANCRVARLAGGERRVTGAAAVTADGEQIVIEADQVFVCAGAVQSPALLSRSGIKGVGRGLKVHPTVKLAARFAEPLPEHDDIPVHQVKELAPDITLGGSASRRGYVALALADGWPATRPDVADWERIAVYYAAIRSDGSGRVTAVPGLRSPIVSYRLTDADLSRIARGAVALGELLFAAGADRLYPSIAGMSPIDHPRGLVDLWAAATRARLSLMTIHLFSTVRMGERRDRAAANSFGRVWGYDNLYVNDASLIPDAPGVNPQGTIMAIAARNCAHFLAHR